MRQTLDIPPQAWQREREKSETDTKLRGRLKVRHTVSDVIIDHMPDEKRKKGGGGEGMELVVSVEELLRFSFFFFLFKFSADALN